MKLFNINIKKVLITAVFTFLGCTPVYIHYHNDQISGVIGNGVYRFSSTNYIYWGYEIELEVRDSVGCAHIKDVRSTFNVMDTLRYRQSKNSGCIDEFGGKYLAFIFSNKKWLVLLSNPVTGYRFIGYTNKFDKKYDLLKYPEHK
jgi:hypothetical protein